MNEYKRFTFKSKYGTYRIAPCNKIDCEGMCEDCSFEYERELIDRLGELEDKIENGTLVELPCKVGDKIYAKDKWLDRIFYGELIKIELDYFGFTYLVYDSENQQYYKCREVFYTKSEARLKELRLKELRRGKK